jgi:U2-associated protein SR140
MQQIAEQKLKAFSIGTMGKRQMSKKELEDQRKKEQEEAAAQVCYKQNCVLYYCSMHDFCFIFNL